MCRARQAGTAAASNIRTSARRLASPRPPSPSSPKLLRHCPAARSAAAHTEQVPRHRAQRRATFELGRNVALECSEHMGFIHRRAAEYPLVDASEHPRVLVRSAAQHHAIDGASCATLRSTATMPPLITPSAPGNSSLSRCTRA